MTAEPWSHELMDGLPTTGNEIEAKSHQIIDDALGNLSLSREEHAIIRRMIHALGDLKIAETVFIHPEAVTAGIQAIKGGAPLYCDVNMVRAGVTRITNPIICTIGDDETIQRAKECRTTRAAAAFEMAGDALTESVVVVGNAPTALWTLLKLRDTQGIEPALVIGTPVGFVGAAESKEALRQSGMRCITNSGPRGGSALAAAATNAVALLAQE